MNSGETLRLGLEAMAKDTFCQQMLADSIVCGGAEGVFQRCLMTAVNCLPAPKHFATVERPVTPLAKRERVDLLLYENTAKTVETMAHGPKGRPKDEFYFENCSSFVEIKVIWPKHLHYKSYSGSPKILRDVQDKLGVIRRLALSAMTHSESAPKEFVMIFLNAGYAFGEDGAIPPLDEGESQCWSALSRLGCTMTSTARLSEVMILDNVRCKSDVRFRVYAKAIVANAGM